MADDAKSAKAEAKAAKAHAKAMRPWFKKKRWWAVGAIVVVIIIAVASGGGKSDNNASGGNGGTSSNGVKQGIGSQDASADVTDLQCGEEDALGFRTPTVRVTNNSSKDSDYLIKIVVESPDGSERFDDTLITVNALSPGQATTADGLPFTESVPADAICKITEVERTAAL